LELLNEFVTLLSQPYLMLLMLGAVVLGLLIGILPGLGGSVALALLIPLTFSLGPDAAIVLLISAYGTVTYGGAITSILLNTPGEATAAATTFDGYPLAKQGKAGRAITVAVLASAIGGIFGFLVLYFMLPLARSLVLAFTYPDFFMLAIFGLTVIAVVTQGSAFRGIVSALVGFMLAFIGTDPLMGSSRFTFGSYHLWDGLGLVPVIIGLFAITEAFQLYFQKSSIAGEYDHEIKTDFLEGVKDFIHHRWLFVRSSLIGIFLGMIPGVGGAVASFMAYGSAVQTSKTPECFGKGGGAMLPTLAFGIPGSAAMAVLIGGLIMHGLTPGPEMLTTNISMTYFLIAVAIVSKVIALPVSLLIGPRMAIVTKIPGTLMAPGIVAISFVGAYAVEGSYWDLVIALLFGLIGILMKQFGYSRIALIIALVLGGLVEASYHQTMAAFGWEAFFNRPISLTLLGLTVLSLIWPWLRTSETVKRVLGGGHGSH
jgi:putative tricarboxylic transport membrane protein